MALVSTPPHPRAAPPLLQGLGLSQITEAAYERVLSLPVFPARSDGDIDRVVDQVTTVAGEVGDASS